MLPPQVTLSASAGERVQAAIRAFLIAAGEDSGALKNMVAAAAATRGAAIEVPESTCAELSSQALEMSQPSAATSTRFGP